MPFAYSTRPPRSDHCWVALGVFMPVGGRDRGEPPNRWACARPPIPQNTASSTAVRLTDKVHPGFPFTPPLRAMQAHKSPRLNWGYSSHLSRAGLTQAARRVGRVGDMRRGGTSTGPRG